MTYILLIIITLSSPEQETKDIELRIPYNNEEKCLKASKKIDFSFKFPGKEITTKSELYNSLIISLSYEFSSNLNIL